MSSRGQTREAAGTGSVEPTTTLTMSDGQQSQEMETTITEVEPQHMVSYTWGTDLLRWNLEPIPRGTRLTLNQTSSSLDWLPKLAAGWHICLDVAARQLAGEDAPRIVGMEAMNHGWADLHVAYASVLGIDPTPLPES